MARIPAKIDDITTVATQYRDLYVRDAAGGYRLDTDRDDAAHALEQENHTLRIDNDRARLLDRLGEGPGLPWPDSRATLLNATRESFRVVNGKVVVVDKDGDPTGQTVEQFFRETARRKFPRLYQSGEARREEKGKTRGDAGSRDSSELSSVQKIAAGLRDRGN